MLVASKAESCTRVVYLGPEERILTGRNMDWKMSMDNELLAHQYLHRAPVWVGLLPTIRRESSDRMSSVSIPD
ncbi:hypothetical protein CPA45_07835 [Vreelandella nigrificans]|uniref:Uncharacterized protein n=1 Tax=Vreelandella nigrificans TaxID=2042704 RepID=A0A2A4HNS1_9GAMM|nr:hypothetical protein CPA45_07835 [Halomonas nigrificans]